MKALLITGHGNPGMVELADMPIPRPRAGEALIRVRACALNYLDLLLRDMGFGAVLPHISGSDVAGEVVKTNGSSPFEAGDAVVINPSFPCGVCGDCQSGRPCDMVQIFGFNTTGGFAEYVVAPIGQLYPKPPKLSWAEAAAFPLTFLTAWHMLVTRAKVQKGETVFVWGASGGLGSAGVQVAKLCGARVIAAAKTAADAKRIKAQGADEVLIYTRKDLVEAVHRLTNGGVDVVYEMVGAKTWASTLAMLRPHGRVVIAGTISGDAASQDLSDLYYRQLTILGSRMGTSDDFAAMLEQVHAGTLKPVVDKVYPLTDFAAAEQRLADSKHIGKVVVEI